VDETLLEYPDAAADPSDGAARRRVCAICGARFSGDARFCPFDGEPLSEATDHRATADPLLGTVVDDRYCVLRELGEGGMGTVYEVEHVTLRRHFALKALRRGLANDESLSARFIQEAKAAAAISHPNIVQIADYGQLPTGEPYFVMELLAGAPLSRVIREEGRLSPERAVPILRQISEALAAAHEAGVIHRDLKPDNIQVSEIVGERELVKVLDFGLAKVAGGSKLTRAGMVFGTPHYMSPEQAAGDPLDGRSDVYALGVVMYEMLTGHVPFEADTFMGVLSKHMYMQPARPSEVVGPAPELGALEQIALRCLQKKPELRYSSMLDLLDELERVVADPSWAGPHLGRLNGKFGLRDDGASKQSVRGADSAPPAQRARRLSGSTGVLVVSLAAAVAVTTGAIIWQLLRANADAPSGTTASAPFASGPAAAQSVGGATRPARTARPSVPGLPSSVGAPGSAQSNPPGSLSPRPRAAGAPRRTAPGGEHLPPARQPASAKPPGLPPQPRSKPKIGGGDIVNPWEN
jgi:hypothetical protein